MKKYLFLSAAALGLASCSNDFLGEGAGTGSKENLNNAIVMGGSKSAVTRADITEGAAAAMLNNSYIVEGIKGDGSNQDVVFDHYNVNYKASTAGTTESNTKDWEYVGQTLNSLTGASEQTIKFWDYAATQYDFIAVSLGKGADDGYGTFKQATLTKIDYTKLGDDSKPVYVLEGSADELASVYVADLVTLYNRDGVNDYGKVVTPRFRSLGTKVRFAFYETVPGYSVKNVKFYNEAWDGSVTSSAGATSATVFTETAIFPSATSKGKMSVYYPTVGWSNRSAASYNQPTVKYEADASTPLVKTKSFGDLDYKAAAEGSEDASEKYLGRISNEATYAGTGDYYQVMFPLGTSENIQVRIEYDLVSTDGSDEIIHVRDARAVVPKAYTDWKLNYAYTYIFKISNNTNGYTGVDGDGDVVEGITPITFDAVVVDDINGVQETITTMATPSITTYQAGEVVTANSEYKAGDIYASVMNGTSNVTLTSANIAVYTATTTGSEPISEATVLSKLNGKTNGITLTAVADADISIVTKVPVADGTNMAVSACKIAATADKVYVFVYDDGAKKYVKVIKVVA